MESPNTLRTEEGTFAKDAEKGAKYTRKHKELTQFWVDKMPWTRILG